MESEIARLVESAARAAEAGDRAALADMVSRDYEDDAGRDQRAVAFLVRTWLGRYPGLLVVVSDLRVEALSTELANARMTVNLLGRDGSRPLLAGLDAERLRLRVALRREGDRWRVTRADWDGSTDPGPVGPN